MGRGGGEKTSPIATPSAPSWTLYPASGPTRAITAGPTPKGMPLVSACAGVGTGRPRVRAGAPETGPQANAREKLRAPPPRRTSHLECTLHVPVILLVVGTGSTS